MVTCDCLADLIAEENQNLELCHRLQFADCFSQPVYSLASMETSGVFCTGSEYLR